jgi:hypothetical protein
LPNIPRGHQFSEREKVTDRTPIFNGIYDAAAAAHKNGKLLGKMEMKKEILALLKDRKRIDDALLKKIEEMKCH